MDLHTPHRWLRRSLRREYLGQDEAMRLGLVLGPFLLQVGHRIDGVGAGPLTCPSHRNKPISATATPTNMPAMRQRRRRVFWGLGSSNSVIRRSTPENANQAKASSIALATDSIEPMPSASVNLP